MLVHEIMHPDPITIDVSTKLSEAYQLMVEKSIRHLPILKEGKLTGIVTDRDLRLATSRLTTHPFNPEDTVESIMSSPVNTVGPGDPLDSVIKVMRELKIGCLPVVEDDKVVGIVTGVDILDAMILLTGIKRPSGRLDLRLVDRPGEIAKITQILAERKINIHSVLTYLEKDQTTRLILRLGTMEIRLIAETLCNAGFEVLWPPHISCVK